MALLTDAQAAEIARDVEDGVHGPVIHKHIRALLADRAERVRLARERQARVLDALDELRGLVAPRR